MIATNKLIDHTLLKPDATIDQIQSLCDEAKAHDFMSVCINPCWVVVAKNELKDSDVKVCTVIGFPLGANTPEIKVAETKQAIDNGADEIDMVLNIGQLKAGNLDYVTNEIAMVKQACGDHILKVILETCLLSDEQIVTACHCAQNAKADFVKTSTGFSSGGATIEAVKLMHDTVGSTMGVKASGGVKTKEALQAMVDAGATRIGTSNGTKLV